MIERLYSAVKRRRRGLAITSESGTGRRGPGAEDEVLVLFLLIKVRFLSPPYSNCPGSTCLTHLGTEGWPRRFLNRWYPTADCCSAIGSLLSVQARWMLISPDRRASVSCGTISARSICFTFLALPVDTPARVPICFRQSSRRSSVNFDEAFSLPLAL